MSAQPPFCLLETMRWEQGIALLDLHLARSGAAASTLGFLFDEPAIRDRLDAKTSTLESNAAYRLRLLLEANGESHIEATLLDSEGVPFRRVVLNPEPLSSTDPLRLFKTTSREPYEMAFAWAVERGFDEAILLNERGEVSEGTRTNVWIRRRGQWLTPPLSSGCLGGVYRARMLETWDDAAEALLHLDDLVTAEQLALSNAVHGFLPVELVIDP